MLPSLAATLLTDWFGGTDPAVPVPEVVRQRWYGAPPAWDDHLRSAYGAALEQARDGGLDAWAATPLGHLALVILLDQVPRNVHRGTALAFAWDGLALRQADHALERGVGEGWPLGWRGFLLMPFEHAEDLASQERAVAEFEALAASAGADEQAAARMYVDYAARHRDIIARFGRFPHRNAALGRTPTPAELAWLESGGERFGQG